MTQRMVMKTFQFCSSSVSFFLKTIRQNTLFAINCHNLLEYNIICSFSITILVYTATVDQNTYRVDKVGHKK